MSNSNSHKRIWKAIVLQINNANAMLKVDFKLPNHITGIESVKTFVIPSNEPVQNELDCGELSFQVNNRSQHQVHTSVFYSSTAQGKEAEGLKLNSKVRSNTRINGYYRDNGSLKNRENVFVPYQMKILLECQTN